MLQARRAIPCPHADGAARTAVEEASSAIQHVVHEPHAPVEGGRDDDEALGRHGRALHDGNCRDDLRTGMPRADARTEVLMDALLDVRPVARIRKIDASITACQYHIRKRRMGQKSAIAA